MFTAGGPRPQPDPLFSELEIQLLKLTGLAGALSLLVGLLALAGLYLMRAELWLVIEAFLEAS